jgi:cytoskeleton protein RodZ
LITPQRLFLAASVAGLIIVLFIAVSVGKTVVKKISSAPRKPRPAAVSAPAVKRPAPQKPRKVEVPKPPKPVLQDQGAVASASTINVGLRALEDCWIQAKVDGKMVFQNVLRKGRFEAWEAKDKVELSIGSAGGVQLELNGKVMPSLGRRGMVLKNILITRDGLKVNK